MGSVAQFRAREDVVDLAWGHPRPGLLPVREWTEASATALRRHGAAALTYGHNSGPAPLVEWLCERLAATDARRPDPAEVFVTAGASQALELLCATLLRPGDVVLVDSPTYHLALRILADHRVTLQPAPVDSAGIDPDALAHRVAALASAGRRVRLLYLVPTFNNPTGACLAAQRRAALVDVARRTGLVLVEDDTYRELAYDHPAPPSLHSLAGDGTVVRVGSFSKTVAPGLRLGFLTADPALVDALAVRGFVDSGGGLNHATALTMAEFAASGGYQRHLSLVRRAYRTQRDRLAAAVVRHVADARLTVPGGGWFLWVRLASGVDTAAALPYAEASGVSYVDGARFFVEGGGREWLRLSFSMLDPDRLDEGARRLGAALAHGPLHPNSGRGAAKSPQAPVPPPQL